MFLVLYHMEFIFLNSFNLLEPQAMLLTLKLERQQGSGIVTIKHHTCPRIPNGKVTKSQ